jgi:hypothetical protein
MTAAPPPVPTPAASNTAIPWLLLGMAVLALFGLFEKRAADAAADKTKAQEKVVAIYADSLKQQAVVVAKALHVRDSLATRAKALERPAAVAIAHAVATQASVAAEIAAGEKLLADSLASLAQVRAQLHVTDSIAAMLVAQIVTERTARDKLHDADLATMASDTVALLQLQREVADGAKLHDSDVQLLKDVKAQGHGLVYRVVTGALAGGAAVGGGALGFVVAGPAGAIVGGVAGATLVVTLR